MIIVLSSMLYGWLLGVEWSNDGKCAVMFFSIMETLIDIAGIVYIVSLIIDKKFGGRR